MSSKEWLTIFNQLENKYNSASIADGYIGILNVQNNKAIYSNVTPLWGTTNVITNIKTDYNETEKSVLPVFSFNEKEGESPTNKIALNKSYLNIFKDIKSKNTNWNINSIEAILKTNNISKTNSSSPKYSRK